MQRPTAPRTAYWCRWGPNRLPPGADLAHLRRGLGRQPGSVPGMWPLYTELTDAGGISRRLRAEHIALGLYGLHQQSQRVPVHRPGIGLGDAARRLKRSGRYSENAVDRRIMAAASATTVDGLAFHLRGLVRQLSAIGGSLDYDRLMEDLVRWQTPQGAGRVRRRWGGDYYAPTAPGGAAEAPTRFESGEQ